MKISNNNVNVSETEEVQYFVTFPIVIYGTLSIDRQGGLNKNELISSITREDILEGMDDIDSPDADGFLHTLTWKEKNVDGTFSDTLFWYNDISVENAETCEEVI